MNSFLQLTVALFLTMLVAACSRETVPNPGYQPPGGNGGTTAGAGGDGAVDDDAGGSGGTGGDGGRSGAGGTGGDGGSPDCDDDSDCSATLPRCGDQGRCISCTSNASCDDRGDLAYCEMTRDSDHRGQCVACLEDEHCKDNDDGEYCLNNECVPCEADSDCKDLSKPQCGTNGQCTGCTADDACNGRTGTEACVLDPGPKRGHCVACIANNDCPDADAPQCTSNNICGYCTNDDACSGRGDTQRCELRIGADNFGQCVECTGATEDDDCDGKSCKQSTGECTDIIIGDLNPCDACEADSQCGTGTKCVGQTISAMNLGHFCFPIETSAGCASASNTLAKPYSQTLADTLSIDSTEASQQATYCLPPRSCEAVLDTISNADCEMDGLFDNSKCGIADLTEGQCLQSGAAMGTCSYICTEPYECPQNKPNCSSNLCSP